MVHFDIAPSLHHVSSLSQEAHFLSCSLYSTCNKSMFCFPSQKMGPYHIFAIIFLRCYTKHLFIRKFLCWSLAGKVCAVTISLLHRASAWMKVIYSIILHVNYMSTLDKISLTEDVKDNRESSQCSIQNEFAVSHLEA